LWLAISSQCRKLFSSIVEPEETGSWFAVSCIATFSSGRGAALTPAVDVFVVLILVAVPVSVLSS
jgi:hypothetical protein